MPNSLFLPERRDSLTPVMNGARSQGERGRIAGHETLLAKVMRQHRTQHSVRTFFRCKCLSRPCVKAFYCAIRCLFYRRPILSGDTKAARISNSFTET